MKIKHEENMNLDMNLNKNLNKKDQKKTSALPGHPLLVFFLQVFHFHFLLSFLTSCFISFVSTSWLAMMQCCCSVAARQTDEEEKTK